jgi:GNAT superfamily N-acetyltransferase
MGRYTVFDRHFDHTTSSKNIYVLEWDSVPIGYVAFHIDGKTLWLDYILVCETHAEKRGAGSALLSHVENFARSSSCERIALWAIESQEKWYRKRQFLPLGDGVNIGNGENSEKYVPMAMSLKSDMRHYF